MGSGILWQTVVSKYRPSLHPQMKVKTVPCTVEVILTASRNAADFSGLKLIWNGLMLSGNVFCGLMSQHFRLFMEIMDVVFFRPKKKITIQIVASIKFKIQRLSWCGGVLVGNLHICEITINDDHILERHTFTFTFTSFSGRSYTERLTKSALSIQRKYLCQLPID